jgi:hypothetical protein
MPKPKQFWCSCGSGHIREAARDRHCWLMKHAPTGTRPEKQRRPTSQRSRAGRATRRQVV